MQARGIFGNLPEIETGRLRLRKLTPEDAAEVFAYASDPAVARHTSWEPYRSVEEVQGYLRRVVSFYEKGEPAGWGLELKESGRLVGTCGFEPGSWSFEHARISLGYVLAREHWGQGLMPEAVRATIAFGFGRLDLNRVEARCVADNTPSERVMQKAGMSHEGTMRDLVFRKGSYRDYEVYSILRREHESPA